MRDTWLEFTVADTGPGFTTEALDHALDPFFTTKGGEGSGLGLSMVYDRRQAGGRARCGWQPDRGRRAGDPAPAAARRRGQAAAPRLVLLVEDSADLRAEVREMLTRAGPSGDRGRHRPKRRWHWPGSAGHRADPVGHRAGRRGDRRSTAGPAAAQGIDRRDLPDDLAAAGRSAARRAGRASPVLAKPFDRGRSGRVPARREAADAHDRTRSIAILDDEPEIRAHAGRCAGRGRVSHHDLSAARPSSRPR